MSDGRGCPVWGPGKKGTTQSTLVAVDVSAMRGIGMGGLAAVVTVAFGAKLPLTVAVPKDAFPGSAATIIPKTTSRFEKWSSSLTHSHTAVAVPFVTINCWIDLPSTRAPESGVVSLPKGLISPIAAGTRVARKWESLDEGTFLVVTKIRIPCGILLR